MNPSLESFNYKTRIIMLVIIATLLQGYFFIQNLEPFIGIELNPIGGNQFEIEQLHRLGWGKANNLIEGDRVVYIDGEPTGEHWSVIEQMRIEDAEELLVRRSGRLISFPVDYRSELFTQYFFYLILPLLFFIFILIFTYFIFQREDYQKSKLLIITMGLMVSLAYSSTGLQIKMHDFATSILTVVFLLSPSVFYHFLYHFFKERRKVWFRKGSIYLIYGLSIAGIYQANTYAKEVRLDYVILPIFVAILAIVFFQMVRGLFYLKQHENFDSLLGFILAIGFAVAPFVTLYIIPFLLTGMALMPFEYVNIFLFFIPFGFLYMILSEQLYLLRFQIKKLPYYLILSSALAISITLVNFILLDHSPEFSQLFSLFFYTLMVIIGLFFVKKQLDHYFRPQLFVSEEAYQASLFRFSEILRQKQSRKDILQAFLREVREVLPFEHYKLIRLKDMLVPTVTYSELPERYTPFLRRYQHQRFFIGRLIGRHGLFAMPINNYKAELYILIFQTEENELSKEQLDYLSSLVQFANIALENRMRIDDLLDELEMAKQSDNMEWLSRLLFHWSENERQRLASDIHDTFLQDLIVMKRQLERFSNQPTKISSKEVNQLEESVQDIIYEIRETCRSLYPTILDEVGFVEAIKELTDKFSFQSNSKLTFETNIRGEYQQTQAFQLTLYRIIQEWLSNAYKHAEATRVTIRLRDLDDRVLMQYEDNGQGMKETSWTEPGDQMGLLSIKERVKSLNGTIKFNSELGEGTRMEIVLPYHGEMEVM